MRTDVHTETQSQVFLAVPYVIAKRRKWCQVPTGKWKLNTTLCSHLTEYYSSIKGNDVLTVPQLCYTMRTLCLMKESRSRRWCMRGFLPCGMPTGSRWVRRNRELWLHRVDIAFCGGKKKKTSNVERNGSRTALWIQPILTMYLL